MKVRVGPWLLATSCDADLWRFRILVWTRDRERPAPDAIRGDDARFRVAPPSLVVDFGRPDLGAVWSFAAEADRTAEDRSASYHVAATFPGRLAPEVRTIADVAIPARDRLPRAAFFSCCGFSSQERAERKPSDWKLWQTMRDAHVQGADPARDSMRLHLLLGGGDLIYTDRARAVADLTRHRDGKAALREPVPVFESRALHDLLRCYEASLTAPYLRDMLARVPGLYTWDDHEIIDGWGSYAPEVQADPYMQALFRSARAAFVAIQLGGDPVAKTVPDAIPADDTPRFHLLRAASFAAEDAVLDILLLDLRSDRTKGSVLNKEGQLRHYDRYLQLRQQAAAAGPRKARHLFVVSSIPLVHLEYALAIEFIDLYPGDIEIKDDLNDQWEHKHHRGQRDAIVRSLFAHRRETGGTASLLSGDVHHGARTRLESTRPDAIADGGPGVVYQFTASGIVHPPTMKQHRSKLIERVVGAVTRQFDDRSTATFEDLLPPTDTRLLFARNFLVFDFPRTRPDAFRAMLVTEAVAARPVIELGEVGG